MKLKMGLYWAASCGGCEITVLDMDEKLLEVSKHLDIIFWPVAMDTKYKDVEDMPDKYFDIVFFNGGIRNEENEHMAKLLRRVSKTLVAFGSCAIHGCVIGLGNIYSGDDLLKRAYLEAESNSKDSVIPAVKYNSLTIPAVLNHLKTLDDVVEVDYYIPGCPPPPELIYEFVQKFIYGQLPPKGSYFAPTHTLCKECPRNPSRGSEIPKIKEIPDIKRIWEINDEGRCYLEMGLICMGPVTRAGCNHRCINANHPCTGCMGTPPQIIDAGAKLISLIGGILRISKELELDENKVEEIASKIKDYVGTFYLYSYAKSLGRIRRLKHGEKNNYRSSN